jgi:hypothetical protein
VLALSLSFAESLRVANRHYQPHVDEHHRIDKEMKLEHQNKRLRAERNAYLSFGALFMALVISQLWSLLNRVIDLVRIHFLKTF